MWAAGRATGKSAWYLCGTVRSKGRRQGRGSEAPVTRHGLRTGNLVGLFMKFIGNFEKRVEINRTAKNLAGYKNAYSHLERFIRSQYKVSDIPFTASALSFIENIHFPLSGVLRTDLQRLENLRGGVP